jgi:hypothetical protein
MIGPPPLPDLPPLPPSRSRRNEEALRAMAGSVPQRFPGPEASQFLRAEAETAGLERDRLRADTARPGWSILTIAGREYPVDLGLLATWHAALRDPRPPPAFLLVRLAPPFPGGPPGYLLLTGDGFTRSYAGRNGLGEATRDAMTEWLSTTYVPDGSGWDDVWRVAVVGQGSPQELDFTRLMLLTPRNSTLRTELSLPAELASLPGLPLMPELAGVGIGRPTDEGQYAGQWRGVQHFGARDAYVLVVSASREVVAAVLAAIRQALALFVTPDALRRVDFASLTPEQQRQAV